MSYLNRNGWLILTLMLFCLAFGIFAQEAKMGDEPDGNRAVSVHIIDLFDADSSLVWPEDQPPMPFSTKYTCGTCHSYDIVRHGWHFNAADSGVAAGRKGEPWVLADRVSGTQIPLSHRGWAGTMNPEKVGLTPWDFVQEFGRHMTGGGVGENDTTEIDLDIAWRWLISGKLEVNCLACHDAEAAHDQAQYAPNTRNQNFRWAAASTAGFAEVKGSAKAMPMNYDRYLGSDPDNARAIPPQVIYDATRFNSQKKVFFDVVRDIPNERCYFCHSTKTGGERHLTDEDVHMAAGLSCVDCHNNGLNHAMQRGYEAEDMSQDSDAAASYTCKGCHLGDESAMIPRAGHFAAPRPKHTGFPTIHFEKMACTSCHSGPWPEEKAQLVQTSRTHALGTYGIVKGDSAAPYIYAPVCAKDEDGKVAPHKMMWPSFWAHQIGDDLQPISLDLIKPLALAVIQADTLTDSMNIADVIAGKWPKFSEAQIVKALDSLTTLTSGDSVPVYVTGGKVYSLADGGKLKMTDHQSAEPYMWAFAHDVRPKAQALGSQSCGDCHSNTAAFNFGKVDVPSAYTGAFTMQKSMTELQDYNAFYFRVFAFTFLFRPILKLVILICFFLLAAILLLYFFKGLDSVLKVE